MRKQIFISLIILSALAATTIYLAASKKSSLLREENLQHESDLFVGLANSCNTLSQKTGSTSTLYYINNGCDTSQNYQATFSKPDGTLDHEVSMCVPPHTVAQLEAINPIKMTSLYASYC
ncbi:hypothetical protein ABPG74_006586 [Tetrahymena malaccensis]